MVRRVNSIATAQSSSDQALESRRFPAVPIVSSLLLSVVDAVFASTDNEDVDSGDVREGEGARRQRT